MATDPDTLCDPAQLRNLMKNAEKAGRHDLVLQCQVRLAELAGQEFSGPLEREFWAAITAAEEIKTQENNRTTRLARTRQKVKRVGVKQCLLDLALDPNVKDGFRILVEGGYPGLTAEAIVVRHGEEFPPHAVESAAAKLLQHGIDREQLRGIGEK